VQRLVREHSIVKLLAEVSTRALQVLLRATHKERSKPALLRSFEEVQNLLPGFVSAWAVSCGGGKFPAADKQLVAEQLQQTGGL
jgi:hypothetical protein